MSEVDIEESPRRASPTISDRAPSLDGSAAVAAQLQSDTQRFSRQPIQPISNRVPLLDWPVAVAAQLQADAGQYNSRSRYLQ